ncbi:PREDICTED: protein RRP6-like 1 [Ipomoea nil]|uniref:protein RRP6-like 1 n=1 Tax=Ipomoea nil TaxID=35883 RepID=UPI000901847C|nr:PREDICTED: protein RRP6-like 1 [Ipomoea nil]
MRYWKSFLLKRYVAVEHREDTHFLLYIYGVMKIKLLSLYVNTETSSSPLAEVYKLSYDICMQLYTNNCLCKDMCLFLMQSL